MGNREHWSGTEEGSGTNPDPSSFPLCRANRGPVAPTSVFAARFGEDLLNFSKRVAPLRTSGMRSTAN